MGIFKDCGCGCNGRKQEEKLITSIISGLTFFVIANPRNLSSHAFGLRLAHRDADGVPLDRGSSPSHRRVHPSGLGYDEHQTRTAQEEEG